MSASDGCNDVEQSEPTNSPTDFIKSMRSY
jgi:hypothetical protein